MDEFSLISHYFSPLSSSQPHVLLGIGDDCALLTVPEGKTLAVSTDSLVCGVHFLNDWDAFIVGYKALVSNVSDLAAMGAEPAWVSLALTLPSLDEKWLARFVEGFKTILHRYNMSLIGGDITKGPLQITLTVHGFVDKETALKRSGAKGGDLIYVTGSLGEPAYAVSQLSKLPCDDSIFHKLFYPTPRISHGLLINRYASSAIDISDGLAADLDHILLSSQKGAIVSLPKVPVSSKLLNCISVADAQRFALTGGDEYELCFTVSPSCAQEMERSLEANALEYYQIGTVLGSGGLIIENEHAETVEFNVKGYQHF